MTKRNTLSWLVVLLVLFLYRVLSQLVQYFVNIPWLPDFGDWHSATIPYALLFLSQIVIVTVIVNTILNIQRDKYDFKKRRASFLLWIGGAYFLFMLIRLILSLTFMSQHPWFGATLPALFHLVLAAVFIVTGLYETQGYRRELDE